MKSLQIMKAKHILHNCNMTKLIKSHPLSSEVSSLENTDNTNYTKYQPIFGKFIKELLLPERYSCHDRPPDDVSNNTVYLFNSCGIITFGKPSIQLSSTVNSIFEG